MKMNMSTKTESKVLKLAKKAGFVIWSKNDYNFERIGKVDWACEYDEELVNFYNLVREELLSDLEKNRKAKLS